MELATGHVRTRVEKLVLSGLVLTIVLSEVEGNEFFVSKFSSVVKRTMDRLRQ